jgi:hypothetical protein
MANKHRSNLLEVKALVDDCSPQKRIRLYRFLASVADNRDLTRELLAAAKALEEAEKMCSQLDFKFSTDHLDGE